MKQLEMIECECVSDILLDRKKMSKERTCFLFREIFRFHTCKTTKTQDTVLPLCHVPSAELFLSFQNFHVLPNTQH
jgi:hypothetical protein